MENQTVPIQNNNSPQSQVTPEPTVETNIPVVIKPTEKKTNKFFSLVKRNILTLFFIFLCFLNFVQLLFLSQNTSRYKNELAAQKAEQEIEKQGITEDTVNKIAAIDKYLPQEKDLIDFVQKINLAKSQFKSFTFTLNNEDPVKFAGATYFPFEIKINGDLVNILIFSQQLVKSTYLIRLDTIQVGTNERSKEIEAVLTGKLLTADDFK